MYTREHWFSMCPDELCLLVNTFVLCQEFCVTGWTTRLFYMWCSKSLPFVTFKNREGYAMLPFVHLFICIHR